MTTNLRNLLAILLCACAAGCGSELDEDGDLLVDPELDEASDLTLSRRDALANGGFENGCMPWRSCELVGSPVHGGSAAAREVLTASAPAVVQQNIRVQAGAAYDASVHMLTKNATTRGCFLRMIFRDSDGVMIGKRQASAGKPLTWRRVSVAATAPTGAVRAQVVAGCNPGVGQAYIDDAMVVRRQSTIVSTTSIDDVPNGGVHVPYATTLNNGWVAQTFTAPVSGTLRSVELGLYTVGELSGVTQVYVIHSACFTTSCLSTLPLIGAVVPNSAVTSTSAAEPSRVMVDLRGVAVTAGQTYGIYLQTTPLLSSDPGPNPLRWATLSPGSYDGGELMGVQVDSDAMASLTFVE